MHQTVVRVLQHRETRAEVKIIRENKQRKLTSGRYIRIQNRDYTKTFPSSALYYSVLLFFIQTVYLEVYTMSLQRKDSSGVI